MDWGTSASVPTTTPSRREGRSRPDDPNNPRDDPINVKRNTSADVEDILIATLICVTRSRRTMIGRGL
jgi:hypothetical protein